MATTGRAYRILTRGLNDMKAIDSRTIEAMTAWRRDLHAHPELAFAENRTSDLVARELAAMGLTVHRGLGKTGVVGTLSAGAGPSIGLRADMDALPMTEANVFGHRSRHAGAMHACGHDGHTAMLLGAARHLAQNRDFRGTVHFIFQPAEEGAGGGKVMVREGLFERFPCEAVYGMHNWPGLPAGTFAINHGPMTAASFQFDITVQGKGTHAAMPEKGIDPIVVASHIVLALQTIPSRVLSAMEPAVVSVTQVHGGSTWNVIPDSVRLGGTVRCFSASVQKRIEETMRTISQSIAQAHGASAVLEVRPGYPSTINTTLEADIAVAAARLVVGEQNVKTDFQPSMGSEDFAFMLEACPGAYIALGADGPVPGPSLHNTHYDFNDSILGIGAAYWVALVQMEVGLDSAPKRPGKRPLR